jgi:hypothetical protein
LPILTGVLPRRRFPSPPIPAKWWKRKLRLCLEKFQVSSGRKLILNPWGSRKREVGDEPECGWIPIVILKPEVILFKRGA